MVETHLAIACKHQNKFLKGFTSSLSNENSFEVSITGLVVESGGTDHMMINKM